MPFWVPGQGPNLTNFEVSEKDRSVRCAAIDKRQTLCDTHSLQQTRTFCVAIGLVSGDLVCPSPKAQKHRHRSANFACRLTAFCGEGCGVW